MNYRNNIIYYFIFHMSLYFSYNTHANITNGIGEYIELGKQVYVVSLTTPQPITDVKQLLESDTAASISMRITARKISPRRFITMWIESSTVNTNSDTMGRHIANFSKFGQLFQGELVYSDIVSLQYAGSADFKIYLNDSLLGAIDTANSGEFFRVLLAGWLGDIPLSSTLKKSLLSPQNLNPRLLHTLNTLAFRASRKDLARQWRIAREQAREQAQQLAVARATPASQEPNTALAEQVTQGPPPRSAAPHADDTHNDDTHTDVNTHAGRAAATEQQSPSQAQAQAQAQLPTNKKHPAIESLTKYKMAKANIGSKKSPPQTDTSAVASSTFALDEESLNMRQQYYQQLTKLVLKYQTLPRKAFQRRIEDDLRVLVSINRNGHIVSLKLTEKSEHTIFNKQAITAVKKAEPFPKVPEEIPDPQFTFTIPMQYRLPY